MGWDGIGWDGIVRMGRLHAEVRVHLYNGTAPVHALAQRSGDKT